MPGQRFAGQLAQIVHCESRAAGGIGLRCAGFNIDCRWPQVLTSSGKAKRRAQPSVRDGTGQRGTETGTPQRLGLRDGGASVRALRSGRQAPLCAQAGAGAGFSKDFDQLARPGQPPVQRYAERGRSQAAAHKWAGVFPVENCKNVAEWSIKAWTVSPTGGTLPTQSFLRGMI